MEDNSLKHGICSGPHKVYLEANFIVKVSNFLTQANLLRIQ